MCISLQGQKRKKEYKLLICKVDLVCDISTNPEKSSNLYVVYLGATALSNRRRLISTFKCCFSREDFCDQIVYYTFNCFKYILKWSRVYELWNWAISSIKSNNQYVGFIFYSLFGILGLFFCLHMSFLF